jgi:Flp pilus assembly protein TadB
MHMESFGGMVMFLAVLFLVVLAVLGVLMPFFVFRIRNEIIKSNEHLAALRATQREIVGALEQNSRSIQAMSAALSEAQQEKVRTGLLI